MIEVTKSIRLDEREIKESFVRASGPGGQNVNKVSSAVELRFNARFSPSLPEDVRQRLMSLAGRRLTLAGEIVIFCQTHRSQERNRDEALSRLVELIRAAAHRPKTRRPTKPGKGAKERRLEKKKGRATTKKLRRVRPNED
jgi:ribosome-associated protein